MLNHDMQPRSDVTSASCFLRVAATTTYCDATCVRLVVSLYCLRCFACAATSVPFCCQWMRASFLSEGCGSTLGIAKLCGKGWIASQALAVILYMFNQEVPFPRSASSVCSFRCASVGAIHDEYNDVLLLYPMLFTSCSL